MKIRTKILLAKLATLAMLSAVARAIKRTTAKWKRSRTTKEHTLRVPYTPDWKMALNASSYRTSTRTLAVYKSLLRFTQICGALPVHNLGTIGTEKQAARVGVKKTSLLFLYSLVIPLIPTCYMFYELTGSPVFDDLSGKVNYSPISGKPTSWLANSQTEVLMVLITGLIPLQVLFECHYTLWALVSCYPELLLNFLPVCRDLEIPRRKQIQLVLRATQPLLLPLLFSHTTLAYPTIFKVGTFKDAIQYCLVPTWIYLIVFSAPDVTFSATCALSEVLIQKNLQIFRSMLEKATNMRETDPEIEQRTQILLRKIRKRASVHFALCKAVDKIVHMYRGIYRFDFVVSLVTIIIHGYLAYVNLVRKDAPGSFGAFFKGFFSLLRMFHVIKAAAGPQIKSERMLKQLSSLSANLEHGEIQQEVKLFLIKSKVIPIRLIDNASPGRQRYCFTLILSATLTCMVILLQPFLSTSIEDSMMYNQKDHSVENS